MVGQEDVMRVGGLMSYDVMGGGCHVMDLGWCIEPISKLWDHIIRQGSKWHNMNTVD